MENLYHKLRKSSPEAARMLVREVLKNNNGNVSKTARILCISRATVRRARDEELHNLSRKPKRTGSILPPFVLTKGGSILPQSSP